MAWLSFVTSPGKSETRNVLLIGKEIVYILTAKTDKNNIKYKSKEIQLRSVEKNSYEIPYAIYTNAGLLILQISNIES